ncbi:hypothetical protein T07_1730 [Trichinella nelsoni]|uniref:Uncharacterized protein n=6 Tax=Trichinella TaxID=6333 RepID=A0A0V1LSB6_9BILA|nr:hypothetical protein T07_1730 [Trichinella nelsoni]KRX47179.1 hypothetical protein T05_1208 [Trichinella murrelli]KRX62677.1 hypothetical protein T09_11815 [Trichinella sp. T9]KRY23028.1 hypothetical protein T12_14416 [Trichinella patagoniensis]KRY39031.1 hypothetical protein T01_1674 [Trichinella spiralis]KRY60414.1 hypothetical protein T03_13559 [Trichinella britovi]KRZ62340.1 hypothetical protein T02_16413 [Trichinella nativa]KRZ96427.1 hypothetical protein T08_2407 [Trichinella sp. T8
MPNLMQINDLILDRFTDFGLIGCSSTEAGDPNATNCRYPITHYGLSLKPARILMNCFHFP